MHNVKPNACRRSLVVCSKGAETLSSRGGRAFFDSRVSTGGRGAREAGANSSRPSLGRQTLLQAQHVVLVLSA